MKQYLLGSFLLTLLISACEGFGVISSLSSRHEYSSSLLSKVTALRVSQGIPQDNHSEEFYRHILEKAKDYVQTSAAAGIDSTEQALSYLQSIYELQNDCSVGTITGNDLCNIDDEISDLVYRLNNNVNSQVSSTESTSALDPSSVNTKESPLPLVLLSLFLIASVMLGVVQNQWQTDRQQFTTDEWIYALRGGYLNLMLAHYVRNGGL